MSTTKSMLTTKELADRWRMSEGTLENWRQAKTGPRYVKLGAKRVVYRMSAILEWERERSVAPQS